MTDLTWIPIAYREFYDIPRSIVVQHEGVCYYLESSFDQSVDEYNEYFDVYRLSSNSRWDEEGSDWSRLAASGQRLGRIKAAQLRFDATRRKEIDGGFLEFVR